MKTITVTIAVDGSTQIATSGFAGSDCLKETVELEQKLGKKVKDTKTAEFHKVVQKQGVKQ